MRVRPLTLKQANEYVARLHRHHKPVVGHRFSIGCYDGDRLVGVAIVGRPVSRNTSQYGVAEVTRLCTDGTPNACSMLYGACARAAKALGYDAIQTFTLSTESGTSLRASGWRDLGERGGGNWNSKSNNEGRLFPSRREDQPMTRKRLWRRALGPQGDKPNE